MIQNHRYVFVGGLHRSGTSLVARLIAGLPGVGAISDAPVPENEGVYLQGAIPHTAMHGAPMHFATDPAQHHTEGTRYDTLETRLRIEADWEPHFGPGHWRVEKSPVNLSRMRLYQQLFPLSQFVVVIRHPEAVSAATAKWVDLAPDEMLNHWLDAHEIVARDLRYLHSALVLRYEDLVSDPVRAVSCLAAFLQVAAMPTVPEVYEGNQRYVGQARLSRGQTRRAHSWGYGPGMQIYPTELKVSHALRSVREQVGACFSAALQRPPME
ncbi:sulfotransferase family protein [Salipiger thiooxidans]|uniref:sulfotransferase family protein n=1 Tax=Salipiger thiooxidans TaxID=282683 RepID=UPI001CD6CC3B|nr:sulfotransferase [Salipiger thiooxidans]MCA0850839.1 sulfotransferase [Salipiger thiooxidans]